MQCTMHKDGADLGQNRENGAQVGAGVNELQRHKVLHNGFIVPVDEMTDGFHHAKLDVVIYLSNQTKVKNCQAASRGPNQVAGVRIGLHVIRVTCSVMWYNASSNL